jgi:hypothetical protein
MGANAGWRWQFRFAVHSFWSGVAQLFRQPLMIPDPSHPITNLDATFSAIHPKDTHRVMEALRQAGVYFDVTINGPKDDPSSQSYDIFWFRPEDDQQHLGNILREALAGIRSIDL